MSRQSLIFPIFLVFLASLLVPLPAFSPLAGIVGIVSDPSGAAIIGATVQATNTSTGLEWQVKTREQGDYSFELLPPGVYVVEASAAGFSAAQAAGVQLLVNATSRIDFRLALPTIKENVRVEAQPPLVETETS